MKFLIRFVQLIFLLFPLALLSYLSEQYFVPSGVFEIQHSVNETSPYIDALAPSDRVQQPIKKNDSWSQAIIADPVFFFLHPHRAFARVSFDIWFQNETAPIVEFGGLVRTNPDGYDLQPLHNLLIDKLSWRRITDGTLTLFQKNPKYNSISDFFSNPPKREQVAVYKADYPVALRLSNYEPSSIQKTISVSLRGSHELKTYIKNEILSFEFEYMDMNRDEGSDSVIAIVFDENGKPIADARAADDGNLKRDAVPSEMKKLSLSVPGLSEGVYKVVLNAPRDIFFRKIHTTQNKIVFLNMVYIGDEIGYREVAELVSIWTTSERFQMQTRHAEGVQNVLIDGIEAPISEPYEMFTFQASPELKEVKVPKGDIEIFVDSPIAFAKSQYFVPDPVAIRPYTDIVNSKIEFILTTYNPPRQEGEWLVKTFEFATAPLVFEKNSWKFTFSSPLIEELGAKIIVKEINMEWYKKSRKVGE
ncbi:hypothetical protein HY771_02155 [Candidatus Uhrbacteria bacterium]|nr:hypothetical protein [Candidatus Uhrbacteria bacterium]